MQEFIKDLVIEENVEEIVTIMVAVARVEIVVTDVIDFIQKRRKKIHYEVIHQEDINNVNVRKMNYVETTRPRPLDLDLEEENNKIKQQTKRLKS